MKVFNTNERDEVYHKWISLNKPTKMKITFKQVKRLQSRELERRKYKTLLWWWPEGMREIEKYEDRIRVIERS